MNRLEEAPNKKKKRACRHAAVPGPCQAIDLPKRSMNTLLSLRLRATAVAVLAVLAVLALAVVV